MTIHYCNEFPCKVCTRSTTMPWIPTTTAPPWNTTTGTFTAGTIKTSWGIPIVQRFYTWREAILTALGADSTQRPTVKRDIEGRWVVTTYPQPYMSNVA